MRAFIVLALWLSRQHQAALHHSNLDRCINLKTRLLQPMPLHLYPGDVATARVRRLLFGAIVIVSLIHFYVALGTIVFTQSTTGSVL